MVAERITSRARTSGRGAAVQRFRSALICVATVAVLGAAAPPALGHTHESPELDRLSVDQLKRFYLWCGRAAATGQLDNGAIMQCSIFYEALKARAFGGDFERLHAWSRGESAAGSDQR